MKKKKEGIKKEALKKMIQERGIKFFDKRMYNMDNLANFSKYNWKV